jgi:NAD-dependent DNA ligase
MVTEEERADLHETLAQLIGGTLEETGAVGGMATRLPVDTVRDVVFGDRRFCFTGKFVYGPRSRCEASIAERGGIPVPRVKQELNYLVIGMLASRDWVHTSHGRKDRASGAIPRAGPARCHHRRRGLGSVP